MEGNRLILNDGTVIENGRAGKADKILWLWLPGWTMAQAAEIFFDPAKTGKIIFQYGEMEDVFTNYTNCTSLMMDSGEIAVSLERR